MKIDAKDYRVREGDEVHLAKWPTKIDPVYKSKEQYKTLLEEHVARMKATSIEPARPASEHRVSLSHHSYLIRSVSGSDELALFDMFSRSSPEDLRLRCLGMIKDFPRLAAARLARCDRDLEIALVAVDGEGAVPGEIVGVVHLIEEPAEPGCAEFDILVRTDVKSHGVGFQLMKDVLARARERRLTKIVGFIAGENQVMLLMASELGFVLDHAEMGTVRVTAML